jgi:hypothetical protein
MRVLASWGKMESSIQPRSAFGSDRFERLDAEYLRGSSLLLENDLIKHGGIRLGDISGGSKRVKGLSSRKSIKHDTIVKYLDIDGVDLYDGLPFPDEYKFGELPSRAKHILAVGDLLISNVRPNRGAVTLATERLSGVYASSGFTRISGSGIDPERLVLYAFLRTSVAREQLVRRNRGSMYPAVLETDVLDLKVPLFDNDLKAEVSILMSRGLDFHDSFFRTHMQTSELLNAFLSRYSIPPSPLVSVRESEPDVSIVKRSSAFDRAKRLDAEFYRGEYDEFHLDLELDEGTFPLGKYFSLKAGSLGNGDVLVPTFKQCSLTNIGINWSAIPLELGKGSGVVVMEGDVLLASTAHEIAYVGAKVDVVRDIPHDASLHNQAVADLMVIRAKENKPSYLPPSYIAAFLRHPSGRHQVQRCIRGLRGGHVYPVDLSRYVLVPNPGREWLETFERLAQEAEHSRVGAKDAINRAVQLLDSCCRGWSGQEAE